MKPYSFPIAQELELVRTYLENYIGQERGMLRDVLSKISLEGKMLRPALLLLAAKLGHEYDKDRLCRLGALLELVHIASLIHDDIVDDSPLRRGKTTVQHGFGKDIAVYTGDFILARIVYHLLSEGLNDSGVILARAVEDMCRGEIEQYKFRHDPNTPIDSYINNIRDKTASMFVAAFEIAALESGCSPSLSDKLRLIGLHMGLAFQLRDDILDFGQQSEGKLTHRDFRDGIFTLPVLHALRTEATSAPLRNLILSNQSYSDGDISKMHALVHESGGITFARTHIQEHTTAIHQILNSLDDNPYKSTLTDVTSWLAHA